VTIDHPAFRDAYTLTWCSAGTSRASIDSPGDDLNLHLRERLITQEQLDFLDPPRCRLQDAADLHESCIHVISADVSAGEVGGGDSDL